MSMPLIFSVVAWNENLPLRILFACVTAYVIGMIIGPIVVHFVKRYQLVDSNKNCDSLAVREQNKSKKNTPILGGLIIFIAFITSICLWATLTSPVILCLLASAGFGFVGLLDDIIKTTTKEKGLSAKFKMFLILIISLALSFGIWNFFKDDPEYLRLQFLKFEYSWPLVSSWLFMLWVTIVLSGSTNAVNLTDGMDGLAIVCSMMIALGLGIASYCIGSGGWSSEFNLTRVHGVQELAIVCSSLIGAGLAFLWYNSHPASIFMGDSGALMLGGILGCVAIFIRQEILFFIMSGVFVIEAISVILQVGIYKIWRTRIFRCAPMHHHFALGAWKSETKVVIRFWICQFLFTILGLSLLLLW